MIRKESHRVLAVAMSTVGLTALLPALILGASQYAGDAAVHAPRAVTVARAHLVAVAQPDVTPGNPQGPPWT